MLVPMEKSHTPNRLKQGSSFFIIIICLIRHILKCHFSLEHLN